MLRGISEIEMEVEDRSMDGELFLQIITLAEEFFVQQIAYFHFTANKSPTNFVREHHTHGRGEHKYKFW